MSEYEDQYEAAMAVSTGANWEATVFAHRKTPPPVDDLFHSGSALLDRCISERKRIRTEWAGRGARKATATAPVTWDWEWRQETDYTASGLSEPKRIWLRDIQKLVAARFNISVLDLKSHRRHASIIRPRQIAMYLARHVTLLSLPQIARGFGDRDHTTVLHAIRRIDHFIASDLVIAAQVSELMACLK